MKVPLVDLRASFLPIREEVLRQFDAILSRMDLFLGANVQSFEHEFAVYCEVDHGIGVSSGTDALFAARVCDPLQDDSPEHRGRDGHCPNGKSKLAVRIACTVLRHDRKGAAPHGRPYAGCGR